MRSAMCPRPRILISIEPSSVCLHVSGVSSSMVSQHSILDCGKPNNCQLPLVAGAKMEGSKCRHSCRQADAIMYSRDAASMHAVSADLVTYLAGKNWRDRVYPHAIR